jgi:TonB-linked SusC/RagA family outer membrane protein
MRKLSFLLTLLLLVGFTATAQMQITGTVTNAESGDPIPGASVVVKNQTSIGTATDMNGDYALNVPSDARTLVFSFVGMQPQEVAIQGRSRINVALEPSIEEMEEVVVMGYTTKGKNQITGSTVQVESEELEDVPVLSVDQALQGKVAGFNISTSSGTPGAVQDIRIRGVGSILASNQPLFVIDGVPVVNSNFSGSGDRSSLSALSSLNNNDIESITVLKDASATSAYGARGSNGVIVITTKSGRKGQTEFNFSAYRGFQNRAIDGYDVLTGAQREELLLEAVYNTYGESYNFGRDEAFDFADTYGLLPGAYYGWVDDGRPNAQWDKNLRKDNAPTTNISLSASGGDETSQFYASVGYNATDAVIKGSTFKRINASLNYTRNLSDVVRFSTSNTVSNARQDGLMLEQGAFFANPMMGKYFMSSWYQPYNEQGEPNTNTGSLYNWLFLKDHDVTHNDMLRGISNSHLEWEIIEGLKFKSQLGLDYVLTNYKNYQNRIYGDSDDEGGTASNSDERNFNLVSQNSLSYDFSINDHNFSVMTLLEYQENKLHYVYAYGENFATDGLTNVASAGANFNGYNDYEDWKNASYLGMLNYNYQGRYILDFTYRKEGSSRFSRDYRFGDFWSVGAAWNLSQEAFFAGVDVFDRFRIRGSYGASGNSGIDLNQYQALLGYSGDYADAGAIFTSGFGNNQLTWEKNHNYDVGLDFGLLNNRINGSFAYFNRVTSDLLQNVPLSRTSGFAEITSNVGEVVNKGFETTLDLALVRSNDFNLNLSMNYSNIQNEVTKLAKDPSGETIVIETGTRKVDVGNMLYEWNMRKYAGVNPDNGNPMWYLNGKDGETTEDYYAAEKAYQGASAMPTYSGGAALHIDFKGFYFDGSVYFAGGHKVFEDWAFYTHHSGLYTTALYQGVATMMDRWQQAGDETDIPKVTYDYVGGNGSRTSTRFLYDGDYLRVKNLVLGYRLPESITSKIGFRGASLYVRGTNMFTFVKDNKLKHDPEIRADGFTRMTNPPIKSLSLGLNLNF